MLIKEIQPQMELSYQHTVPVTTECAMLSSCLPFGFGQACLEQSRLVSNEIMLHAKLSLQRDHGDEAPDL